MSKPIQAYLEANKGLIGRYLVLDKENFENFRIIVEQKGEIFPDLKPYVEKGGDIEYSPVVVRPDIFNRLLQGGDMRE